MITNLDPARITSQVRAVTDSELAFYHEHGWVKLPGLISPSLAAELVSAGKAWHAAQGKNIVDWIPMAGAARVEPFQTLVHSEAMGRNAQKLIDRQRLGGADVAVRYRVDHFVCKLPQAGGTPYHQDTTEHGTDRGGEVQFWIALADCTPDMGTMRFYSGVHREGPIGSVFYEGAQTDLVGLYPRLAEHYPPTEPIDYRAGDATVHHGFMVHGAGPNLSDRERLSYIVSYTPADSRWWNGRVGNWGSARTGLQDASNPLVPTA